MPSEKFDAIKMEPLKNIINEIENSFSAIKTTTLIIINKEAEMFQMISEGGPFGLILALTAIVCFVFIGLSIKYLIRFNQENYSIAEFNINNIIHVGIFGAALGFLGTILGGYNAISAIREATDVSMYIVYGGINVALSTTILGLQLFVFSAIVWIVLKNILVRMKK